MITIHQAANLLSITPAEQVLPLLSDELSYWHRSMAVRRRGSDQGGMQFERVALYSVIDGQMLVLAGYLNRICRKLQENGMPFTYENLAPVVYPEPDYHNLKRCIPGMELLFGQSDVLAYMTVAQRGTFKAPTGYGKSYLARALCALFPTANIAICGPASDIVTSTYERLLDVTPHVGRIGGGHNSPGRITVCTAQSLHKLPIDHLDFFIYDEVHTAPAATYREALARIRRPKMFGFSANLEGRADGADMVIEGLFGPKLFEVTYQQAVQHNIVLPVDVHVIDLNEIRAQNRTTNHSTPIARKRWFYWRNPARNHAIARYINEEIRKHTIRDDPQILVLVDTLEHALFLKRFLSDFQLIYASSDLSRLQQMQAWDLFNPETDTVSKQDRKRLRNDFEADRLKKVIATSCWGTGVDFPSLDVLCVAAGPASEIVSTQWPGRVSRIHRGGAKTKGIVVDIDDRCDDWAHTRFKSRLKVYKDKGWNILSQVYT